MRLEKGPALEGCHLNLVDEAARGLMQPLALQGAQEMVQGGGVRVWAAQTSRWWHIWTALKLQRQSGHATWPAFGTCCLDRHPENPNSWESDEPDDYGPRLGPRLVMRETEHPKATSLSSGSEWRGPVPPQTPHAGDYE